MRIIRRHHISFKNAFAGLLWAFRTQPNFRVHFLFALLAVGTGWFVSLNRYEWMLLTFTIVLGLVAELINTSLETMTDLITKEWRQDAKIAKDVAAGMMLTVAIGAVIVGILILGPKLIFILF